jgi:aminopeptidase-like protein
MIDKFLSLAKKDLFQINRSITGKGVRQTLRIYKKYFKELKIKKVKCGEKVFDWQIPNEWNVREAYVLDKNGKRIIDFKINNLHLVGYSVPKNNKISKTQLLQKLHSLPKQPNAIPYVTSYYKKNWGFCINDEQKKKIIKDYANNDKFKIVIKSSFKKKGFLNYGELVIKGQSNQEILISTYICHPSMANNELSGSIVSLSLIDFFKRRKNEKTLRFIFIPETIGSITYISKNIDNLKKNVVGGYNLSCIGDERAHSCILTKYGDQLTDKALKESYDKFKIKFKKYSFLKRGSDERQFNHPGVDLPIATICRSKFFEYPEYHTSLDDFKLVTKKGLYGGFKVAKEAIQRLQKFIIPKSKVTCEPQLGKRGLYKNTSIKTSFTYKSLTKDLLSFLQYSDGKNDIEKISKYLKTTKSYTHKIYLILKKNRLVD